MQTVRLSIIHLFCCFNRRSSVIQNRIVLLTEWSGDKPAKCMLNTRLNTLHTFCERKEHEWFDEMIRMDLLVKLFIG